MAGKVKMPNKKTTITIAIIIAILAVVIAIGTVVFLKDRGSTEAAEIESNQFAEQENGTTGNTPAEQNNGEIAGNQGTLPNAGEQANAESAQNPAGGVANANNGGVQNNQIAGAAGQNAAADNIQETTIQRTETIEIAERQILEGHYVGWTPMSVNADLNYAKLINAKKDNLEINKVCETKTGENTTTKGEVITYKISVRNNSEKDLEGIEVKDLIPEMTTYVENSSNAEALELTGKDGKTVVALKWNIDLKAGEATEISFQVKVSETATGTIRNVAVVNGEETNETETAIVTSTKTAEVIGKTEGTAAKVGDKIKYTITVKNTGDVAGKANVKDESLAKLIEDGILEVEETSKETAEKLMAGTEIEVAANSESKVEFTVVVKKVSGAIKNVATVGEEKPEETVDTTDYTIKKEVTSTAKNENGKYALGEVVTYKVTVTNTGSTVLKTVTVNDSNSEEKVKTATNIAVNGKAELTFTHIVTEADIKEGEVVNVATSDGKETEKVTVETEEPFTKYDLVKTVTGTDKDKDGKYALGETITYKVTVTNRGNQTVKDVVVTDNNSEEKTATVNGELKPGESKDVEFTHIVTEKDITAKKVVNVATIGDDPSNEVTTETEDPITKYDLVKTVTSTAKNENGKYALGETITYKVTVTNKGNQTVSNVVVTDNNSEEKTATVNGELKPGENKYVEFTHIVTEKDITAKKVVNVATIGDDPSNEVTTETEDPITKYDLVKTVTSTAKNENGKYALGETIKYKVTVTNKGNQTVKDVVVTDNNSEEKKATVNGELKPGESKDVTFTHIVTEKDITAKKVVNVATIGDDPSNEVTTETEDPITKYDLVKTVTSTAKNENGKYALGETITYKVTVTNRGNQTVSNVVVTDNNSEEKKATVNGELKPGESKHVIFTHIVTEADIEAGEVVNVATIGDDSSTVTTDTEDPFTDYELLKTVISTDANNDGKYALGETITYNVKVTNKGNQTVKNVVVTDNNSVEKTQTITEEIAPNASANVTFTHVVDEDDIKAGEVVNVATIGDDSSTVTTDTEDPFTDYELLKTVTNTDANNDGKYALGETITYNVKVTNKGNQTVKNVVVTDNNSVEKTKTITEEIAPKASANVTFTHVVDEDDIKAGEVVNVATIGDDTSNEVTTETEDPITKYELLKTVTSTDANNDGKYALGETITYNVKVTNKGNQTVKNVVVTDNNSVEKTKTITEEIAPNASADVTFTHIVTEADIKAGEVVNVATIGDDSSTVTTDTEDPNPNFVVTKTATKVNGTNVNGEIAIKVGDKVTYIITVENTGNVTLENVVVTDELLPEFSHTIATLNRGADNKVSVTVEYTVQEKDIKDGKLVNIAKATIPEKEKTGEEELPVSNISIEKHVAEYKNGAYTILSTEALEKAVYNVGDTVWYAIKVTNNGKVKDTVTVTDTLVNGLEYANEASEVNVSYSGKTITWNNVELAAGETRTLYVKARITSGAISGTPVSSTTTGGTSWWKSNNDYKEPGKQNATAQLFIRKDGKILENDENKGQDVSKYTSCVGTVNLTAKNLAGNETTTDANAIKIGTATTPTTVEEYALQNYKIFQYILDGTDLNTIARNLKNEGITFNPETQMIVCYVLKYQADGYHIDAVIRDKSIVKVDLYNLKNIATVNGEDSNEVTIKVSDTTEITDVTVKKEWANTTSTPESVDVQLYAGENATAETATLNEGNNWTYTWDELNKYDANNKEINYSVKEISIDLENKTVTPFENNSTNGDYKVTYATTGNTTTITNTFVRPEINVTKKQYDKDNNEMAKGTKVQYGDTITYKIVATNSGNAEGTVTLKDTVPANSELVGDITLTQGRNTTRLTVDELVAGKIVTLGENETATLQFTVKAKAYAGEKVTNTAYYDKDDEKDTPTETTQSDIEAKTQVIPTVTTTSSTKVKQKVILVLDYSASMANNDRITNLRTAVRSFLNDFLDGNNEVMIIKYSKNVIDNNPYFTKNYDKASEQLDTNPNGGTNIDAGLKKAYEKITDQNTSVILMTDGLPSRYIKDNGQCSDQMGNGSSYTKDTKIAADKAIARAEKIKTEKGAKIYSIGFGLDKISGTAYDKKSNYQHAKEIIQAIASPTEQYSDGTEKKYWFDTVNADALTNAFSTIYDSVVSEADGEPIDIQTTEGKMVIADGFEAGQNVEIYTGEYTKGTSTPKATYSWNEFISSDYVQENEDGTITFNLTQYMKDNNIAANEKVTIRFVDPQKANVKMKSARLMSLVMDATEDAESEEDIAEYEQKIEKAEQAKATTVKEESKPATTETPNKETTNNTVVETENTKPSTDNKENNKQDNKVNEEIKDKENTTTTEKPAETTNTTTEEAIKNNQNNGTDNTTSSVNE